MADYVARYQDVLYQTFSLLKIKINKNFPDQFTQLNELVNDAQMRIGQFQSEIYSLQFRNNTLQKAANSVSDEHYSQAIEYKVATNRSRMLQRQVEDLAERNLMMTKFAGPANTKTSTQAVIHDIVFQNQETAMRAQYEATQMREKAEYCEKLCESYQTKAQQHLVRERELMAHIARLQAQIDVPKRDWEVQTDIIQTQAPTLIRKTTSRKSVLLISPKNKTRKLESVEKPICKIPTLQVINFDI
eukprot:EST48733.1 Hypothetical protein SS50377_11050 [Spironucleus salmonicida]